MRRDSLNHVINVSVNQTLGRTVITSGTALLTALALFFFGGEVLHGFAFTMVVGIITGTYSSVFIAAAIVSFWRGNGADARRGARAGGQPPAAAPQQPTRKRSRSGRRGLRKAHGQLRLAAPAVSLQPDACSLICMPTLVQAALLGIVQGLTEFLPVSSTAHLLIGERLLGFDDPGGVFTVMIQLGSILAVMWLYRAKIARRSSPGCRRSPRRGASRCMIVLATRAGARRRRAVLEVRQERALRQLRRHRGRVHRRRHRHADRRAVPAGARRAATSTSLPVGRALAIGVVPGAGADSRRLAVGRHDRRRRWRCGSIARPPRSSRSFWRCRRWPRRSRTICWRCGTISASARGARDRGRLRDGVRRVGARRQAVPAAIVSRSGFAPFAWYRIALGAGAARGRRRRLDVAVMQWLRRSFIAGFFVTVPLFISVAAFIWIFGVVDGLTTPLYDRLLGRRIPGLGIADDGGGDRAGRRRRDQRHRQARAAARRGLPAAGAGVPDDLRAGEAAGRGVLAGQRVRVQAGGDGRGRAARLRARVPDAGVHRRSRPGPGGAAGRVRADQPPVSGRHRDLRARRRRRFPTSRSRTASGSS